MLDDVPSPTKMRAGDAGSGLADPVRVRQVDLLADGEARPAAVNAAGSTLAQDSGWLRAVAETYGYRSHGFIAEQGSRQIGSLPVMEVDSWLTGRRGVALPFTDECAPVASDERTSAALVQEAVAFGRSRAWRYLEIRGGSSPAPGVPASTKFWGHQLSLSESPDQVLALIHPSNRRAIRKAEQSGVQVEISQAEAAVPQFFRLMQRTRRRHGMPTPPLQFYRRVHEHVISAGRGFIVLARALAEPIAAAVFLFDGSRAVYKYGASDERHQHLRANNLVMWRGIVALIERGCRSLDFGRTSLDNDGLRRFKLSWAAEERVLSYFRYNYAEERWVSAPDRSQNRLSALFRHLPLSVSTAIGALLYRHVA